MHYQRLFGTNGVRFIPGKDRDISFVIKLSQSVGTYFREGPVLLGRDGRKTGSMLSKAVAAGLMASGLDVVDAGILPTPCLQYSISRGGYKGGVMVTASHNPPQYNGVKVMGGDGVEIPREDEAKIEEIYRNDGFRRSDWRSVGVLSQELRARDRYIDGIISQLESEPIRKRSFKIVLDAGNGAQALTAPYICENLGCRVFTINGQLDGDFPGRGAEPTPETLDGLSEAVRSLKADLGVAYDGDGDRSVFCDEKGNVISGDRSGSILAEHVASRRSSSTVVTTLATSMLVDFVANRVNAKVLRTKVGSVDVSREMLRSGAIFGLEENGGCFYALHIPVRDGAMATALMLEKLTLSGSTLSSLVDSLPILFQSKEKVACPNELKESALEMLRERVTGRVETLDGVKLWMDDDTWVLVRPSGTEPLFRVFAESTRKERLEEARDWGRRSLEECVRSVETRSQRE